MKAFSFARAATAALLGAAWANVTLPAHADIKDYKFELVDQAVQAGADAAVAVKLINTKAGQPARRRDFRNPARHGTGRHADDDDEGHSDPGRG